MSNLAVVYHFTHTHKKITELIPKQFRLGNSSTQIAKCNSQNNSVRDSVILCSHFLPRPGNSRNKSVRKSQSRNCRKEFENNKVRFGNHVVCKVEIPWPWYNCQNSQNAQKCLRGVLKVIWGLPAERPKRVSRTVQTLFRTGGNCPKGDFAPCKRLFWESHPGGQKTPFAPSLSTFGHSGCFDSCTRAAESQV